MTRRKRWSIWAGIICAVLAAQFIYLSTITSPDPNVRHPPAEPNRVVHPAGFSIVKPGRTRAIVLAATSVNDDEITILPDGGRSRYTSGLYVRRLRQPPDLSRLEHEGFRQGAFQGHDSLVYKGPSGEYFAYRVMTNRGGQWYEVSLLIPGADRSPASIPSPEWQRYLETFAAPIAPTTTTRAAGDAKAVQRS
jgi:hypothetical protein